MSLGLLASAVALTLAWAGPGEPPADLTGYLASVERFARDGGAPESAPAWPDAAGVTAVLERRSWLAAASSAALMRWAVLLHLTCGARASLEQRDALRDAHWAVAAGLLPLAAPWDEAGQAPERQALRRAVPLAAGYDLLRRGRPRAALDPLRLAARAAPPDGHVLLALGMAEEQLGTWPGLLAQGIREDPALAGRLELLGRQRGRRAALENERRGGGGRGGGPPRRGEAPLRGRAGPGPRPGRGASSAGAGPGAGRTPRGGPARVARPADPGARRPPGLRRSAVPGARGRSARRLARSSRRVRSGREELPRRPVGPSGGQCGARAPGRPGGLGTRSPGRPGPRPVRRPLAALWLGAPAGPGTAPRGAATTMTRLRGAGLLAACGAWASLAAASPPPEFPAESAVVRLDVYVGRGGAPLRGLTADDFEVRDRGRRQRVSVAGAETRRLHVVLALDRSASLRGAPLEHLRVAARALLARLDPTDAVTALAFDYRLDLVAGPGAPDEALPAVDSLAASGPTALRDALHASLKLASPAYGRPLVVLFSDGADRASFLGAGDLLAAARGADAAVYAVLSSADGADELDELCRETGGRALVALPDARLAAAFVAVLEEAKSRYLLSFEPSDGSPGWHPLDVRLRGRTPRVEVRARRGYQRTSAGAASTP